MNLEERQQLAIETREASQVYMDSVDVWINDPTPENQKIMQELHDKQAELNKLYWNEIFK